MRAVAATVFEMLAMGKTVEGVTGCGLSRLVMPARQAAAGQPQSPPDSIPPWALWGSARTEAAADRGAAFANAKGHAGGPVLRHLGLDQTAQLAHHGLELGGGVVAPGPRGGGAGRRFLAVP